MTQKVLFQGSGLSEWAVEAAYPAAADGSWESGEEEFAKGTGNGGHGGCITAGGLAENEEVHKPGEDA